jgi:pimeloyl-ACP methyl ester carboxylesterase
MKTLFTLICLILSLETTALSASPLENEQLFTIHGIMGSDWNLYYLANSLEKEQMEITYWGYPSRDKTIMEHGADLAIILRDHAALHPGQPIHFLTHSMGGLVLRAAVNHPECPPEALFGKAILVAPPNQGAAWGRFLEQFALAHAIGKEHAGRELMTEKDFEHLGQFPETMEILVIAGNMSINFLIKEENDGIVAVSETALTTPHHHEVIWAGHKAILLSKKAATMIHDYFVRTIGADKA